MKYTDSLSPQMVLFLWVIPAKGTRLLSLKIFTKCELNSHEYRQFVPPDGTFSLGNTSQRDKTTKPENIYKM